MNNVGTLDQIIRIVLGLALIVLPFVLAWQQSAATFAAIVGIALIATGIVRYCPLYKVLGVSTAAAQ